jgi:hypothetical protein
MTALALPDLLGRLAKVCGMFGSVHDGEVVAAALRAEALVRGAGLTWPDVLQPALPAPARPVEFDHAEAIAFCWCFPDLLSAWDREFLSGCDRRLRSRRRLTDKQAAVLDRLLAAARGAAAARAA